MASANYKISGKHDPKGINDAKKSFASLGKAVNAVSGSIEESLKPIKFAINVFAGIKIFDGLKKAASATTAEFTKNQTALNRLAGGLANNAKLTGGAFERITGQVEKLAKTSMFGGDELANQAAFLSGMNLTEEAIEKTLRAAVDLSHAGIGNLGDNVKKLSDTFNGNITQLGKVIPEFQTLTKEELKAGMAIDVVKAKFKGFAESWSEETSEGVGKQFREVIDDIKSSVGGIFSRVEDEGMKILIPILERVADWFATNGPNIAAHMIAGMKVLEAIVNNIATNLPKLLTPETWKNFFDKAKTMASAFVSFFRGILVDAFSFAVKALQWYFDNFSVQNFFDNLLSGFGIIYDIMKIVGKISDALNIPQKIRDFLNRNNNNENRPAPFPRFEMSDDTKKAYDEMTQAFKDTALSLVDTLAGTDTAKLFATELEKALNKFNNPYERSPGGGDVPRGTNDPDKKKEEEEKEIKTFGERLYETITGALGQAGTLIDDVLTSFSECNIVLSAVTSGVSALSEVSVNFAAVLNFMDTVFKEMAAVIAPLVNELFAPLVSFLQQIGRILANIIAGVLEPLIYLLEPFFLLISSFLTVLEKLSSSLGGIIKVTGALISAAMIPLMLIIEALSASFMWIYNYILRPLFWVINNTVAIIYNGIATMINIIADAVNWIPGVNIKKMDKMNVLSFDDFKDMYLDTSEDNALEDEYDANGGSYANRSAASGIASYTAARDIYVYITYNNSYVNGDARQIALNLRDEIRSAERLGL